MILDCGADGIDVSAVRSAGSPCSAQSLARCVCAGPRRGAALSGRGADSDHGRTPGIMQGYEFGEDPPGAPYLGMEFAKGERPAKRLEHVRRLGVAKMGAPGRNVLSASMGGGSDEWSCR